MIPTRGSWGVIFVSQGVVKNRNNWVLKYKDECELLDQLITNVEMHNLCTVESTQSTSPTLTVGQKALALAERRYSAVGRICVRTFFSPKGQGKASNLMEPVRLEE